MMDGHNRFGRGFGEGDQPFESPDPRAGSGGKNAKAPLGQSEGTEATEDRGRKVFFRYSLRTPHRACGFRLWGA